MNNTFSFEVISYFEDNESKYQLRKALQLSLDEVASRLSQLSISIKDVPNFMQLFEDANEEVGFIHAVSIEVLANVLELRFPTFFSANFSYKDNSSQIGLPKENNFEALIALAKCVGWRRMGLVGSTELDVTQHWINIGNRESIQIIPTDTYIENGLETFSKIDELKLHVVIVGGSIEEIQSFMRLVIVQEDFPLFLIQTTQCEDLQKETTACGESCIDALTLSLQGTMCVSTSSEVNKDFLENIWNPNTTADKLTLEEALISGKNNWNNGNMDPNVPLVYDMAQWFGNVVESKCNEISELSLSNCYEKLLIDEAKDFRNTVLSQPFEGMTFNSTGLAVDFPIGMYYFSGFSVGIDNNWKNFATFQLNDNPPFIKDDLIQLQWPNGYGRITQDMNEVNEFDGSSFELFTCAFLVFLCGICTCVAVHKMKKFNFLFGLLSKLDCRLIATFATSYLAWLVITYYKDSVSPVYCTINYFLAPLPLELLSLQSFVAIRNFHSILLNRHLHRFTPVGSRAKAKAIILFTFVFLVCRMIGAYWSRDDAKPWDTHDIQLKGDDVDKFYSTCVLVGGMGEQTWPRRLFQIISLHGVNLWASGYCLVNGSRIIDEATGYLKRSRKLNQLLILRTATTVLFAIVCVSSLSKLIIPFKSKSNDDKLQTTIGFDNDSFQVSESVFNGYKLVDHFVGIIICIIQGIGTVLIEVSFVIIRWRRKKKMMLEKKKSIVPNYLFNRDGASMTNMSGLYRFQKGQVPTAAHVAGARVLDRRYSKSTTGTPSSFSSKRSSVPNAPLTPMLKAGGKLMGHRSASLPRLSNTSSAVSGHQLWVKPPEEGDDVYKDIHAFRIAFRSMNVGHQWRVYELLKEELYRTRARWIHQRMHLKTVEHRVKPVLESYEVAVVRARRFFKDVQIVPLSTNKNHRAGSITKSIDVGSRSPNRNPRKKRSNTITTKPNSLTKPMTKTGNYGKAKSMESSSNSVSTSSFLHSMKNPVGGVFKNAPSKYRIS
eukprot:TRINITY_DN2871_c0_g1_i1.p1 TRINITY_DN2871_c0_g1~~TRINITY_DN2871_c0_g1_i1.p1  ORF type:complete len:999 (+),score=209.45 TRINITY_DN2871_c0_g1_i1:134-3130(+)